MITLEQLAALGLEPRFYSVDEVAVRLAQKPYSIKTLIHKGALRGRKIGHSWGVHGTAIAEYELGEDPTDIFAHPDTRGRTA